MSEMVVISETAKISTLKLGMWLLYKPGLGSGGVQYVYVESLLNQYAKLSNGLTINADGVIVDPAKHFQPHDDTEFSWATCEEVTLVEITCEELNTRIELQEEGEKSYEEYLCEIEGGWSPPENFKDGTDDEKEIWAAYRPK